MSDESSLCGDGLWSCSLKCTLPLRGSFLLGCLADVIYYKTKTGGNSLGYTGNARSGTKKQARNEAARIILGLLPVAGEIFL